MAWFDYVWTPKNIAHIEEHGLSNDEVEDVVNYPVSTGKSHSSGRPSVEGLTSTGKYIFVAYEWIDDVTVYVVTAYEV